MDESLKRDNPQLIHKFDSPLGFENELKFTTPSRRIIYWIPSIVLGIGILTLLIIIFARSQSNAVDQSSKTTNEVSNTDKTGEINKKVIKIDIEGAINQPGLYEMPNDSRIQDVLISAGGLSAKADRNYVSRYINLSQKVSDGQKLYFPLEGEVLGTSNSQSQSLSLSNPNTNSVTGVVNINDATTSQLEDLVGIGPVTAQKIISGRPYQNITQLVDRKILGRAVFEKIKGQLTVN